MTIGKRIAKKRTDKKITQAALASAVGVTTAFISQIETDVRKPSYALMLKIAHQLQVPLEQILSEATEQVDDPVDKLLHTLIPRLKPDQKKQMIEYAFMLSGSKHYKDFPLLTSPIEYAQFIIQHFKIKDIPVDTYYLAEQLGVTILKAEVGEYEGALYKTAESPLIVLDTEIGNLEREKFTVAILLGHLLLPWHLKQNFYRLKHKKSLDHDDQLEIEARQFAGELLLPGSIVKRDFKNLQPSIAIFEKYAYEKYKCAMTALAHKYSEFYGEKALYLSSEKGRITRAYDKAFPYKKVEEVKAGSLAHSFISNPPSAKETRTGVVDGKVWFLDLPPKLQVHEESMLDPAQGVVITLLQVLKK
ncbi:XRE family transcriptional regulator [Geotalea sp. SG265]|uniref:helix-turn-helix domain-containing protein n=1 Tax=Geotalea sp. SG265 TaxID=2922867 RepID=UPI001FB01AA8|nr:XRE family transcriptional regulator [Geotalea sp. SG265]